MSTRNHKLPAFLALVLLLLPLLAACGGNPQAPPPPATLESNLSVGTAVPADGGEGGVSAEDTAITADVGEPTEDTSTIVTTVQPELRATAAAKPRVSGPEPTAIGQKLDLGALSPSIPDPKQPVTITFQSWASPGFKPFVDRFQKLHPNIKVKLQDVPAEQMQDKLTTQVAGGNAPDAAYVDNGTVGAFAPRKALVELDPYVAKSKAIVPGDYVEGFRRTVMAKGKMYGVPFDGESTGLFYRTDLFKQAGIAGPPKTWEEFEAAAKKLTNKQKKQYGVAIFAPEASYYWYPWLWQTGERLGNADGKVTFNSERGKRAARFYVNLARNYAPPDLLNSNSYDGRTAFANGKVGMYVAGAWFAGAMLQQYPKITGKWAAVPMPRDKQCATTIAGDALVVFSQSEHKDAAFKWIEFLSAPQNVALWNVGTKRAPGSLLPTRTSLLNDPQVFANNPILKGFAQQMECGVSDPVFTQENWGEGEVALNENLGKAIYGDLEPDEALDAAAEEAQEQLDDK